MHTNRFSIIIEKLKSQGQNIDDWWLHEFGSNTSTDLISTVSDINADLEIIDEESWSVFEEKLLKKFKNEDSKRGKSGFFNTLNERYAYQYLLKAGFSDIRFVRETKESTPDISYKYLSHTRGCEVKTIMRSDIDYTRFSEEKTFDPNLAYSALNNGFFKKLDAAIENAYQQVNNDGIIVLIVQFDDFTHKYIEQYMQIPVKTATHSG
jgi:hypothetical protein